MARVLILGGSGWLGRHVAEELIARDDEVVCLSRGRSAPPPPGAAWVQADRLEPEAYAAVDGEFDAVLDVASQPGLVRAALAALDGRVGHWVYISSVSVYADGPGPIDEDSALLPPADGDEVPMEQYGEAKVACEQAVARHPRHLIVRPGLIGGPGDRSDRSTYWVGRCAELAEHIQDEPAPADPGAVDPGAVDPGATDPGATDPGATDPATTGAALLVPDAPRQPTQTIDVRDLAGWLARCIEAGTTGVFNAVGEQVDLATVIATAAEVAGWSGPVIGADADWLLAHEVGYWMGPRSLPLWLPPEADALSRVDDRRVVAAGLHRRPLRDTLADTLADERIRGLGRRRQAGLSRDDEVALLAALAAERSPR